MPPYSIDASTLPWSFCIVNIHRRQHRAIALNLLGSHVECAEPQPFERLWEIYQGTHFF